MPHPKTERRKFLIDELLPPKYLLPKMHKRYDLKHIVHDFKKRGLKDRTIQMFAQKKKRTIITVDKQFVKKITRQTSVLKITGVNTLSNSDVDKRLIQATSLYKSPSEYEGKVITATADYVYEENYEYKKKRLKYK